MNHAEQQWKNIFGEYTTEEIAWHGHWTTYSPNQDVIKSKQAIRGFRSNSENIVVTHHNRYLGEEIEEKTWQIDRATCNQSDGVIHPAATSMRALSFGAGATAWIAKTLTPGEPFGGELFFQDGNWRSSTVAVYGEDSQLSRIVHIREHLGYFSNESLSSEPSELSGNWIGDQYSMSSDLEISAAGELQLSFDQISDRKMILLPTSLIVIFLRKLLPLNHFKLLPLNARRIIA
jgi:Domain of unknown function (DUF3598)